MDQLIKLSQGPSLPSNYDQGKYALNLKKTKDQIIVGLLHLLFFVGEIETSSPNRPLLLRQVLTLFNQYPLPENSADKAHKERKAAKIFNFKESLLGWKLSVFTKNVRGSVEQTEAAILSKIVKPLLLLLKEAEEWEKSEEASRDKDDAEL
eukprot:CAMPEP_0170492976 /NCGR_PEP_ID=MMETSP0208-20121228/13165_1 /TAXON_ID=197538 /ORGANISM="Strombidium inclinatum, Strain S3" /LENGTH=150 /DNA_ID=CAMNT_0010768825 /DNA_START=826 /DNA_END=1275 /DNA_ORIENTATION=-